MSDESVQVSRPGGPGQAAKAFLDSIAAGSWLHAWNLMTPQFRTVNAQLWLHKHRETFGIEYRDLLPTLEAGPAVSKLWRTFAADQAAAYAEAWDYWLTLDRSGLLGMPQQSRPVGVDLELVAFVEVDDADEIMVVSSPTPMVSLVFTMERTDDGWLVASNIDRLIEPGWPPVVVGDEA